MHSCVRMCTCKRTCVYIQAYVCLHTRVRALMLRLLLGHARGLKCVTAPIVPYRASSRYIDVS